MIMILGYGVSFKQKSALEPTLYVTVLAVWKELETELTHAKKASEDVGEAKLVLTISNGIVPEPIEKIIKYSLSNEILDQRSN